MSATGPGERPEVGSLAEEATALLGALSGWMRESTRDQAEDEDDHARSGDIPEADRRDADPQAAGQHDCTCRTCPVCRVISVARQVSPEVRQHLVDAGTSLMAAVAGLLDTHVPPPGARPGTRTDTREGPQVSRIRVNDAPPAPDGTADAGNR